MKKIHGSIIVIDTETDGLFAYKGNRIFCWAYYTNEHEYGFMFKSKSNLQWIKDIFLDPTKTVVFQNAKFDLKMFSFEGINPFDIKCHIDDTMIMSKVIYSVSRNHNLKHLVKKLTNFEVTDKEEIEIWIKANTRFYRKEYGRKPTFKDAPIEIVKKRVLWDVEKTFVIYKFLKENLKKQKVEELYETERRLVFVCLDMENYGVLINITKARSLKQQALKDLKKMLDHLNELTLPLTITRKDKSEEQVTKKFNPNSPLQLPAAFEKLGINLKYRTKSKKNRDKTGMVGGGNWSFDEYAMIRYVSPKLARIIRDSGESGWTTTRFYNTANRIIKRNNLPEKEWLPLLILRCRQISKMISTYYNHFIEDTIDRRIDKQGREVGILHCNFNQSVALTGRFSSSAVNLQNQPRILGPRQCFIPREGTYNLHADYEQVEMKFFVHFAKDKKMLKDINKDIHLRVASEIYDKPKEEITKEQRKRAKGVNFGIIYGAGADKIGETLTRKGLSTSRAESVRLYTNYHKRFPSVKNLTNNLKDQLKMKGYITNPFGRKYHIQSKFAYSAINYLCQGTSADQIKRAMVEIWEWLNSINSKARLIMTIHDEVVIECPHNELKLIAKKIKSIMEDKKSFYVPITIDIEVVTENWSKKVPLSKIL